MGQKEICMPYTAKGRVDYFQLIPDKRNKNGIFIVFHISTEHSHMAWRKQVEQDVKEYNIYIGVHKLKSTNMEIIRFLSQKHPEMTHFN
jgi:cell fate regulator YaaT (PSP1 superfamily)